MLDINNFKSSPRKTQISVSKIILDKIMEDTEWKRKKKE